MKLEEIEIKKFRHMYNLKVKFGENFTVISGQNGTGKSTILGLVGQIFDYKGEEKTKNNLPFAAKYSEIFRFCPVFDKSSSHEYKAILKDEKGNEVIREAESRFIKGEGKYGRFRIDIGDRSIPGTGAINFPVIYLGLKRLFPLAQEKEDSIRVKKLKLTNAEKRFYDKYARDILILLDKTIKPQDIKSPNKEFLAMETDKYSSLGNSAGQDNLGQLLTAILSFRELKNKQDKKYYGGVLLIDEIDATLYAGSQINLMKKLYKFSHDLNLQVIFTTHSLEILELLREKRSWGTEINFFQLRNNKVKNVLNPSIEEIRDEILVQTKMEKKIDKIYALCEDKITETWCKNLLNGTNIKKKVEIKEVPIGASELKELAQKKHPAFQRMLFVLDGDYSDETGFKTLSRMLFLPGKVLPEKIFWNFLDSLDEEDEYWDNEKHFTKQVCFRDFLNLSSKGEYKKWLTSKFAKSYSTLLNRWKKDNQRLVLKFQKGFEKELKKIIR